MGHRDLTLDLSDLSSIHRAPRVEVYIGGGLGGHSVFVTCLAESGTLNSKALQPQAFIQTGCEAREAVRRLAASLVLGRGILQAPESIRTRQYDVC